MIRPGLDLGQAESWRECSACGQERAGNRWYHSGKNEAAHHLAMFLLHFANYLFFFREESSLWLSFVIVFYSH